MGKPATPYRRESNGNQAGTVILTANEFIRFPLLTADPAVGWYAENTQNTLTDPTTNELLVTPKA